MNRGVFATHWHAGPVIALLALSTVTACSSMPRTVENSQQAVAAFEKNAAMLVVTVRNTPTPAMAQAGSSLRDYDGNAYGPSPRAQSVTNAIASRYGLHAKDAWAIGVLGVHCVVFAAPSDVDMQQLLGRLRQDKRVDSAQPLQTFATLTADYRDKFFELQKNLLSLAVPQAHRVSRGEGVRIAVIDTGVDAKHPDLLGRVEVQRNFVSNALAPEIPERHGTAVAGVIAAIADNKMGIMGVAPAARILALRACWSARAGDAKSVCNTFTLAQALTAAIDLHADVVNLSLTGPTDPLLDRLVKIGVERGMLFVAAMPANDHAPNQVLGFPLNTAAVIGVDSVEAVNASGDASNAVSKDVLRAPGKNIFTLAPNGSYDFMSGSSLAAASVSGGIALLLAHQRRLGREAVQTALSGSMRATADGAGSVDFCTALASLDRRVLCDGEPPALNK